MFDDANIDDAVEGEFQGFVETLLIDFYLFINIYHLAALICKFRGSGQTCVCANRIYVHSSVYADFASRLADRVAKFKVGNGLEEGM